MSREAPAPFLRSYRGTRPRFASGTLMSLRAIPSSRASIRRGCRIFPPRLRRGTRHPDAPPSPCFAAESVRADTLRALGGKCGYTRYYRAGRYGNLLSLTIDSTKGRYYPRSDNTVPFLYAFSSVAPGSSAAWRSAPGHAPAPCRSGGSPAQSDAPTTPTTHRPTRTNPAGRAGRSPAPNRPGVPP